MTLLLGIDEGTSAVKAVLYDSELRPLAEARREKRLSYPRAGWVEQDATEVLTAVVDAVGELLAKADGPVTACGLDHQGESVLAWDADTGRPLTPIVTWQDKRSQEVLDRLETGGKEEEIRTRSGMPLDPYFSAGKLAWLLEHDTTVQRAFEGGTLRMGTVDSFLSDRLGAGFATDPSTASRTQLGSPQWDPALLELFGVPAGVLPAIAETAGGPRSCLFGRGASINRLRLRERGACDPGWSRRRTGLACSCWPTPATHDPRRAGACYQRWPGA
jgi:glycerol kinase